MGAMPTKTGPEYSCLRLPVRAVPQGVSIGDAQLGDQLPVASLIACPPPRAGRRRHGGDEGRARLSIVKRRERRCRVGVARRRSRSPRRRVPGRTRRTAGRRRSPRRRAGWMWSTPDRAACSTSWRRAAPRSAGDPDDAACRTRRRRTRTADAAHDAASTWSSTPAERGRSPRPWRARGAPARVSAFVMTNALITVRTASITAGVDDRLDARGAGRPTVCWSTA